MNYEARLKETVEQLFNDVYQGMESEVISIKSQVDQIKTLLVDAIASLHDSFENIDQKSSEQMQLFSRLMTQLVEDDTTEVKTNIFLHAAGAEKSLTELLNILIKDSRESLNAVVDLDRRYNNMQTSVKKVRSTTENLSTLIDLANADSPDMERIKSLLQDVKGTHESLEGELEETKDSCVRARQLLDEVSSRDIEKVYASKAKVEGVLDHLNNSNELISSSRVESNTINNDLRRSLGNAIRALQFEDIVSQSLGHTDLHLDRMDGFVLRLSHGISELHQQNDITLNEYADKLAELHSEIMSYREGLRLEESNPITQSNMDEGDIDLF